MSDTTITPEERAERMQKALVRAQAFIKLHGHENTMCVTSEELFLFQAALTCAQTEIEHWGKLYLMMTKDEQQLKARAEQAEAEAAQLTAERDWLADKLTTKSQNGRDLWRGPEGAEGTTLYATKKEAAGAYKEAARKAVGEGEE